MKRGLPGVAALVGLAFVAAYAEDVHDKRYLALSVERAGMRGAAIVEQ